MNTSAVLKQRAEKMNELFLFQRLCCSNEVAENWRFLALNDEFEFRALSCCVVGNIIIIINTYYDNNECFTETIRLSG